MINTYFTKTSSKKRSSENDGGNAVPAKKCKKRSTISGFDKAETKQRINAWKKYPPAGDWRDISEIKVNIFN